MKYSTRITGLVLDCLAQAITVVRNPQPYLDRGWETSRRFFFSVTFISLVLSKCFHIGVHLHTLPVSPLVVWAPTFFLVDFLLIVIARGLSCWFEWRACRYVAVVMTVLLR